jgi:hypothetical protein
LLLTGVMLCALFLQLVFDLISQYQFWQQRSYGIRAREQEYFDAFWGDLGTQVRSQDLLTPASLRLKERLEQRLGKGGGDIPILIDDIDALVEVGDVFRKAKERNMRFKITQIDLSLATRTAPGRGKGRAPQLQAPGSSSVQVDVESPMDVQELRKIFEETATMWDVSPSHTSTQGQVKATFKLTPKEAFLRKLSS